MTSLFSRLQKLNKEATPEPWESLASGYDPEGFSIEPDVGMAGQNDAALIVECRNSLPAVLNLIEAAQQFIEDVDDALSDDPSGHDAYVRIGARFQERHEKRLREVVAVFVSGQEEP